MNRDDVKQRIDFEPSLSEPLTEPLQPAQHFSESIAEERFRVREENEQREHLEQEVNLEQSLRPKASLWRRLLLLAIVILLISGSAQLIQTIVDAWQTHQWFSLGLSVAGTLVVMAGLGALFGELRRLFRLRHQAELQQTATLLLTSTGYDQGRPFCETLLTQAGLDKGHPAVAQWYAALDSSQNDGEVVRLYTQMVQPIIDQQVRQLITQTATQSAVMVAASPFALVDMALVAWRSVRMVNQIAKLYQVEPGYLGRIRLFRAVLVNMAFVGATEWIQDSGVDWLTQDIAGRFSSRIAQGVGVGILTSRLGVKAMTLCRPVPWLDQQRPKISEFRHSLLQKLRQLFT